MKTLGRIVEGLDRELKVADFSDHSHNGLQVENSGRVRKVCVGVDAGLAFFRAAAERGADLLVCHHGLSWGDSLKRITELNYRRVAFLMKHDMALYACHLPLDAHPRLGNNAQMCRALGLKRLRPFGSYEGRKIGFRGLLSRSVRREDFRRQVERLCGGTVRSMDFGARTVRSVGVVSGGAADLVEEAAREGLDVFLSGEAKLMAHILAEDLGMNAMFAGHYATEGFGVKAVGQWLTRRFRIECEWIDLQVPF